MAGEASPYLIVRSWSLRKEDIADNEAHYWSWLNDEEHNRFNTIRIPQVATRFFAARVGLRQHLSSWLKLSPAEIRLAITPLGKPWLPDFPDHHFNLSHSGDIAMLAMSNCSVGIDIEAIPETNPITSLLASRVLTPWELEQCGALDTHLQAHGFTHYWVCKEALIKACGLGMQLPPKQLEVNLLQPSIDIAPMWMSQIGGDWQLRLLHATTGYCAAVVIEGRVAPTLVGTTVCLLEEGDIVSAR